MLHVCIIINTCTHVYVYILYMYNVQNRVEYNIVSPDIVNKSFTKIKQEKDISDCNIVHYYSILYYFYNNYTISMYLKHENIISV